MTKVLKFDGKSLKAAPANKASVVITGICSLEFDIKMNNNIVNEKTAINSNHSLGIAESIDINLFDLKTCFDVER